MTSRRGSPLELQAKKDLEAQGYLVERAQGKVLWIPDKKRPGRRMPITKRVDFFGAFDLLGVRAGSMSIAVQVTTDHRGNASVRRAKVQAIAGSFFPAWSLQVWRWEKRKGWWKEEICSRDIATGIWDWKTIERVERKSA